MSAPGKPCILIRFRAAPGKGQALADHLSATATHFAQEAGTELWLVHRSLTAVDEVWVYELYVDQAGKAAHEASPAYAAARAVTGSLLGGPPEVFPLLPVGGKGFSSGAV